MFNFNKDPIENLLQQIKLAEERGIKDAIAMSLATATKDGQPEVRAVLFKGMIRKGLAFYTNYDSPKAKELSENPKATLLFYWGPLQEQIRISGAVDRLSREESEKYFSTRPRLSQISAWASSQSQEIPNFEFLDERVKLFEQRFSGIEVPCPPNWGGYRLIPLKMEFWFGREGRLHERFMYERTSEQQNWNRKLVSP